MNCDCHCNGKCKMLGVLEQKIMDVLWSSPNPLKPAEVLKKIDGKYAYTTVMTVLKRMSDKEFLTRKRVGNVFFYHAAQSKKAFASDLLQDLFRRLFTSYGDSVIPAFKKSVKKSGFSF